MSSSRRPSFSSSPRRPGDLSGSRYVSPRATTAPGGSGLASPLTNAGTQPAPGTGPGFGFGPGSGSGSSSPTLLPDDRPPSPDLPLTMAASTVLQQLPRDATAALASAGTFAKDKVVVRFKPVGSAPPLPPPAGQPAGGEVRRKITATQKFEVVVAFVRRALRVQESESVFLYINSSFAPALDEVVGNLHQCFKDANDQLNVSYSLSPAFG